MDICAQDGTNNVDGVLLNMNDSVVGQNELYTFVASEIDLFDAFVNVVRRFLFFFIFPSVTFITFLHFDILYRCENLF